MTQREYIRVRQIQADIVAISKPFVEMKVALLSRSLPKYMLVAGQLTNVTYAPEVQAQLDEIERYRLEAITAAGY